MSDYIRKSDIIDVLKETSIIQDNDLGHLVVEEINRIPTLDEKEIIRKPFERVVKRLECAEGTVCGHKDIENNCGGCAGCSECKMEDAYREAIEIFKEEGGIE